MNNDKERVLLAAAVGAAALLVAKTLAGKSPDFDFRGKTVLITGGSRGLGLVMARELAREGARLAICARDTDELERARTDLAGRGAEVLAVPCDITDRDQVEALIESVRARFGGLDVLINNAGVIAVGPMETMTVTDYEQAMQTHYWGSLYAILAALPWMREWGGGRIVNVASIGGKISVPHLLPYSASKFALVGLSEGLRSELAKDNIVVTTACPGLMRTGSPPNATFKGQHRKEYAWFSISDSLPGISISAEDAAHEILAACRRGDAEVILSVPARIGVAFHGLFPGATADLLGLVNRLLPKPGGIGTARAKGRDSESPASRSVLTIATNRAARENNETA